MYHSYARLLLKQSSAINNKNNNNNTIGIYKYIYVYRMEQIFKEMERKFKK